MNQQEARDYIATQFDHQWQVDLWFSTPNIYLDNCSPNELIERGRAGKVWAVIERAIEFDKRAQKIRDDATKTRIKRIGLND